ncbi:MAG: right-handed parallel beta-helix repeat-containing protein [Deltaproteobacteria bacterium]|jgi:parallel beta-helix repeat protein
MKERLNLRGFGLIAVMCLLCLLPTSIWAADRYVDIVGGNDSTGDGTSAKPWKTLHTAIPLLDNGDVLHVAEGTYSVGNGENDSPLTIDQSNVSIHGAGEVDGIETTMIDGSGATSWEYGIIIAASHVTVGQLGVAAFSGGDPSAGIRISSGTGNVIEGCTIQDTERGILIQSSSSGNIVRNETRISFNINGGICINSNSGANQIYGNTIYDNGPAGIEIQNGADSNAIHNNHIYDSDGFSQNVGIDLSYAGTGNKVYENEIHGHYDHGIQAQNCSPEIRKNRIYDNNTGIFMYAFFGTASPIIVNNLIYATASSLGMSNGIHVEAAESGICSPNIHHNTIDRGTSTGIDIVQAGGGTANPSIRYNIITSFGMYGLNCSTGAGPTIDYNNVWNNTSGDYSICGAGSNDITHDPLYASYSLQGDSPCVDAIPSGAADQTIGEDIDGNPRPQGDRYDMGCYEYRVPIPQSVPIPPGTEVEDYRMVSFTVLPDDPACVSVFGDEMGGDYDEYNFRVGAYDPTIDGYVDCGNGLEIKPGRAFWVLSRNGVEFTVNGPPASISTTDIELFYDSISGNGWNQIGCPNGFSYSWDDVQVLAYNTEGSIVEGPTAVSDLAGDNDMIDKRLWRWDAGTYLDDTTLMEQGEGYWVRVKNPNVFLRFRQDVQIELAQVSHTRIMFASLLNRAKTWIKRWVLTPETAVADSGDSPPLPMADFSGTTNDADSEGGGGGCFLQTAGMD